MFSHHIGVIKKWESEKIKWFSKKSIVIIVEKLLLTFFTPSKKVRRKKVEISLQNGLNHCHYDVFRLSHFFTKSEKKKIASKANPIRRLICVWCPLPKTSKNGLRLIQIEMNAIYLYWRTHDPPFWASVRFVKKTNALQRS